MDSSFRGRETSDVIPFNIRSILYDFVFDEIDKFLIHAFQLIRLLPIPFIAACRVIVAGARSARWFEFLTQRSLRLIVIVFVPTTAQCSLLIRLRVQVEILTERVVVHHVHRLVHAAVAAGRVVRSVSISRIPRFVDSF